MRGVRGAQRLWQHKCGLKTDNGAVFDVGTSLHEQGGAYFVPLVRSMNEWCCTILNAWEQQQGNMNKIVATLQATEARHDSLSTTPSQK